MEDVWGFLWIMIALKIPLVALLWIVWWAIHAEPDPEAEAGDDEDGGIRGPRERPPEPGGPRRRGPHGDPVLPAPPRTRAPVRARTPASDPPRHGAR